MSSSITNKEKARYYFILSPNALKIVAHIAKLCYTDFMGKKEKLIAKLKTCSKNFTFTEAENLLNLLGYEKSNKGKTSGSRIMFRGKDLPTILLHKPHPRKELLSYQMNQLIETLENGGLI